MTRDHIAEIALSRLQREAMRLNDAMMSIPTPPITRSGVLDTTSKTPRPGNAANNGDISREHDP